MFKKKINSIIFLLTCVSICNTQNSTTCNMKETCGSCLQELGCVWCNDPYSSVKEIPRRCISLTNSKINPNWCSKIVNPRSNAFIVEEKPLQTQTLKVGGAVQISPQKVRLTLRRGEEYKLKFKYAPAEDYPVDLYYIMDLSASMKVHKDKLSALGTKLANTMKKLTKNFRLGFGSFVDKVTMPYVNTLPEKLKQPCSNCASPYSFKNHLSLTESTDLFTEQVEKANVSGNLDSPEGGFDALMQAMVCQKEIGWRRNARHLLVFSTDASYHIAGDGKLGGIVEPHDGLCHMENNSYTHSLILDYPSIGQINAKAIENNINIIFAVIESKKNTYRMLKERIKEASFGTLSKDSSNVVDLVKQVYDELVDSVIISDDSDSNIEVKYYSDCRNGTVKETNECNNIPLGQQVDFTALIKVLDCPINGNATEVFQIKPGALNESLTVEVNILCKCECEKFGNKDFIPKSSECSRAGNLQCGICVCDSGKFGTNCECDGQSNFNIEDSSNCSPDNSNSSEICSGFGSCKCNKCVCQKRTDEKELIYGKYCECNNYSCKRKNRQVCSGENRGRCECGKCVCFAGWSGDACECPDNNNTCIAPTSKNKEICSSRGECKCGKCECHLVEGYRYTGEFCDECLSCPGRRCEEFRHCIECTAYNTGFYNKEECIKHCSKFTIDLIEKINEEELDENEKICTYYDNNGCNFKYKYSYDSDNTLSIVAQKEKICNQKNVLAVVLSVIGTILLAGIILLLLWKGVTTFHDRREYARFEKERQNARWNRGENPLFKNPTTTFQNPTFSAN